MPDAVSPDPTTDSTTAPAAPIAASAPPIAKQVPHTWQRVTGDVDDPWAWLRDRDDPDTVAYLAAENDYAEQWLAPHEALVQTVFEEIKSRVQETDTAVPVRKGDWWYTARTVEGLDYPIHCRGASRETAESQVLLDENVEAAGHDFFSLGLLEMSADHSVAAWSSDVDGSELFTLRFRDLATGTDLPDVLEGTSAWGGSAWSSDGAHFFYMMPDDQMRPFQVWRHALGTEQSEDVLVLHEPDERFYLGIDLSRSERWIMLEAASKTTSEAWLLRADQPTAEPVSVRPRTEGLEYSLDHWGDRFVVLTNLDAEDFRVMTAPEDAPADWTELLPHVPGQRIVGVEPFADHLVVHEWSQAQQRVRILRRDGSIEALDLGSEPHELELDANPEWHATTLRYGYQSLHHARIGVRARSHHRRAHPAEADPDPERRPHPLRGEPRVGDGARRHARAGRHRAPPRHHARRHGALSRVRLRQLRGLDAAVVQRRPHLDARPRVDLGARAPARWRRARPPLVHRRQAAREAQHLHRHHRLLSSTSAISAGPHPDRITLRGGSAGGLLVGACMTLRPDLFNAVVAEVPFVDVVTTMSDPSLPLTITEWEEWGDPRDEPFASYMLGYSPVRQRRRRRLPGAAPSPPASTTRG